MHRSILCLIWLVACSTNSPTTTVAPPPPPPLPSAVVILAGDTQTGVPGYRLATQIAVKVVDVAGNGVSGDTIAFRPADPTGFAEPAMAVTDSSGIARTFWRLGGSLGAQQFTATVSSIPSAALNATATTNTVLAIDGGSLNFYTGNTGAMCAVNLQGVLGCWALPHPGTVDPPARFAPISTAIRFTAIAMTSGTASFPMPNSCALSTAGTVWCFSVDSAAGVTGFSQLAGTYPTFTSLSSSGFAGQSYCALTPVGAAWCWGFAGSGGLGDGTFASRTTPGPVVTATRFTQIVPGDAGGCGLAIDGTAWCWGSNDSYQVGTTAHDVGVGCGACVLVPTQVSSSLTFSRLVNTSKNSAFCGIAGAGGLYCWGRPFGPGFLTNMSPVPTAQFTAGSPVVDAAMPGYLMMALGQDGTITTNGSARGEYSFVTPPSLGGVLRGFLNRNGSAWVCGPSRVSTGTLCISDPRDGSSPVVGVPLP